MKKTICAFGEVMLRLAPMEKKRFFQVLPGALDATFGGGEANVCASLAMLGASSCYLTALPDNPISRCFAMQLRGIGCDVDKIKYTPSGRMGIYFAEHGSNMRGSAVIYDRDNSVISQLTPEDYDFPAMLADACHLHLTGITPSLSKNAYLSTLALAKTAADMGVTISIDLNYRKKLWNWEPGTPKNQLAGRCMGEIVRYADIIIGNEEDAADVFGIRAADTAVDQGKLNISGYESVAATLADRFPKAKFIATTLRESISANHNNWGGMLYDCAAKQSFYAPINSKGDYEPYCITDIVDRFGGGDSFCAGLLYALHSEKYAAPADAIRFAVSASALKHTINGDYNDSTLKEVEALMGGSASGRVQR